jgi:glycosyltransferase involved in cell wall biosynthesis
MCPAVYRTLARIAGLHSQVTWQASSDHESADIQRFIAAGEDNIVVAADLSVRSNGVMPNRTVLRVRQNGDPLRISFISRLSPKKNLDFALRILAKVRCPVVFDIYGPMEACAYWEKCQTLMNDLPLECRPTIATP